MQRRLVPNIVTLQAFECAARHRSFSRAAEELNVTQSAVSRQVAELEQQTGLKLFERIRQRVVLSEAGQRLLPEVRALLVQSERLMIGAVSAGHLKTSLRIATLPTFGAAWLVPRLGRFMAANPDIAITLESRSRPFAFAEENFDIAIHFGQPIWAGGVASFLCDEAIVPIAHESLAERLGIRAPADLAAAPLLHLITRPKLWADWFEMQEVGIANAYAGARFDQFSMIVAAVIAGLGCALLPAYLVEEELRSGRLVRLFDRPMTSENAYYLVRPEGKTHPAADLFQDWLLAEAGEG